MKMKDDLETDGITIENGKIKEEAESYESSLSSFSIENSVNEKQKP
jgi:hypothetical protein